MESTVECRETGEKSIGGKPLKALIFDVDGTLYRQKPVRFAMVRRLLRAHIAEPGVGLKVVRILTAYRNAQERLREAPPAGDLAELQLRFACERTSYDMATVRSSVERWMEIEPLDLLRGALHPGLLEFLDFVSRRGLRLGVCSDYSCARKLEAMGIAKYFPVVVSAQDPDVQQFKPSPRGLEATMRRLGVEPSEAVYIGDRPEVDAEAARRAGMQCVIVGRFQNRRQCGWAGMRTYGELRKHLFE